MYDITLCEPQTPAVTSNWERTALETFEAHEKGNHRLAATKYMEAFQAAVIVGV